MTKYLLAVCVTLSCVPANHRGSGANMQRRVDKLDIQGHRGARGLKPENTLPSFETALDLGVTTLEFDLHLTKDDVVVVWHDPVLLAQKCTGPRVTDDVKTAPRIRSLTWKQLRAYRCDKNPDPKRFPDQNTEPTLIAGASFHIATFEELLAFCDEYAGDERKSLAQRTNAAAVRFNFETKRVPKHPEAIGDDFDGENPGLFETEIVRVITERDLFARSTLQSFDHRSLWAARKLSDKLTLAALTDGSAPDFAALASRGATVWSPNREAVTTERVADAHKHGLITLPWTVNDTATMRVLIDAGVDGLISDRPDRLIQLWSDVRVPGR